MERALAHTVEVLRTAVDQAATHLFTGRTLHWDPGPTAQGAEFATSWWLLRPDWEHVFFTAVSLILKSIHYSHRTGVPYSTSPSKLDFRIIKDV